MIGDNEEFLRHAERVLSVALQCGNAHVSAAGTAEMHRQAYRRGCDDDTRGPSRSGLTRRQRADASTVGPCELPLGSCARCGRCVSAHAQLATALAHTASRQITAAILYRCIVV